MIDPYASTVLRSLKCHIFTRSPLRRMVSGSTYTVIPASSSLVTNTHAAYDGPPLKTRSGITNQNPKGLSGGRLRDRPTEYATEHCTGKRRKGRIVKDIEASQ